MEDLSTLKVLLALVSEGNKEAFRNMQKMNKDYPDIFFDVVKMGLVKNPLMIRECMWDSFYSEHKDFFVEFVLEFPQRVSSIPSSAISKNLEIAEAAIRNDGANIRHIPKSVVNNNQYLLFDAIKSNTIAISCASRNFQIANSGFLINSLLNDPRGLKTISLELEDLMGDTFNEIIINNPWIIPSLRNDQILRENRYKFIMLGFSKEPLMYRNLPYEVRNKFHDMAEIAILYDADLFPYVPQVVLENNIPLARKCSQLNIDLSKHMPISILLEHSEIYLNSLKNSTRPGKLVTSELVSKYYDITLSEIIRNPFIIKDISDNVLIKYPELLYEAIRRNYLVYESLSQQVKEELPISAKIAFEINPSSLVWIPFSVLPKV